MSTIRLALTCSLALVILSLTACQTVPYQGSARDVKKRPGAGGIIAVPLNPRQEDRDRADEKMKMNCGNNAVKVTSEEEVVVGETTEGASRDTYRPNQQQKVGSFLGMPVMSGDQGGTDTRVSSTKTAIKEWQIGYECEAAQSAPVPAATPAMTKPKAKKK